MWTWKTQTNTQRKVIICDKMSTSKGLCVSLRSSCPSTGSDVWGAKQRVRWPQPTLQPLQNYPHCGIMYNFSIWNDWHTTAFPHLIRHPFLYRAVESVLKWELTHYEQNTETCTENICYVKRSKHALLSRRKYATTLETSNCSAIPLQSSTL